VLFKLTRRLSAMRTDGSGGGDRVKNTDSEMTRMSDLTVARVDDVWHRTDILGCSYVDVAPVEETRTVASDSFAAANRCSTCTW
jgi:hypothetical protein